MNEPRGTTATAVRVPASPPGAAGFRGDIEGLRGVAVLLVVLSHATGWPRGGYVGVDVFFVVSGYLITGLLVSERERTGRIRLGRFYLRRARRLLPAGVVVLLVTDLAAAVLLMPSRAHATVLDSVWALGFLANTHFAMLGTDYFSVTRAPSAVQHYWSLSVEEQFYLVWPALVLGGFAVARWLRRRGRVAVTWAVSLLVLASLAWSVLSTARTPAAAYFSAPARAWELGAGGLLVLLSPRLPGGAAWLGGAGLVASVLLITPATAVPGYALLLPVLATMAILGAGGDRIGLAARPLRSVGKISYSLYLWHWPCLILGAAVPGGTSPAGRAVLVTLAAGLSMASYHLLERPARVHQRRSRLSRIAAPSCAAVVLVGLVAVWVGTEPASRPAVRTGPTVAASAPGRQRIDPAVAVRAALASTTWPQDLDSMLIDAAAPEWIRDRCLDVSAINELHCVYGPTNPVRTVAVLGDSEAVSWMPGLRIAAAQRRVSLHLLTRRQCPNLIGYLSPHCAEHQDWAVDQVRRLRPDVVLLSARYEGSPTPEQWLAGTRRMIAAVAPYAGRVVVLAPPPETADLQTCFTRHSQPADCVARLSQRWVAYSTAEQQAAAGTAAFLDPRSWFCLDGRCPAVIGGVPVMFDGRHLTAAFAARLAPQLADALG